jgi:hypothetical protein
MDIYKDKREFVYCDCCGAMATKPLWIKANTTPEIAPAVGVKGYLALADKHHNEGLAEMYATPTAPPASAVAMSNALEALKESIDLVTNDYKEIARIYSNYPIRAAKAKIAGRKLLVEKHQAAITSLEVAIASITPSKE